MDAEFEFAAVALVCVVRRLTIAFEIPGQQQQLRAFASAFGARPPPFLDPLREWDALRRKNPDWGLELQRRHHSTNSSNTTPSSGEYASNFHAGVNNNVLVVMVEIIVVMIVMLWW